MELVNVLVVDDRPVIAEALARLLDRQPGFAAVAWTAPDRAGAAIAAARPPAVALLASHLPGGEAARAVEHLRAAGAAVVVYGGEAGEVGQLAALEIGATGHVPIAATTAELFTALQRAAAGDVLVSPGALFRLLRLNRDREDARHRLTPREREILSLMMEGSDNRLIARRLGISIATVRTHVQNVLDKLGAHSRLEAVAMAGRLRLAG